MEALTVAKAKEIMKARGYTDVSHTQSGDVITSVNFIKYLSDEIRIHANVSLKGEDVTLSFVEMKHLCELKCGRFAFDHRDFEKFEQIIMAYAAKCLDIDVFQVLALLPLKTGYVEAKPQKKDVKERKREFWDKIAAYGKEKDYSKDMCLKFYNYWIESNEGGKKLRFEMQKVFDIKGRMRTWYSKDQEYSIKNKNFTEQKIDKQNKEQQSTSINKKDMF